MHQDALGIPERSVYLNPRIRLARAGRLYEAGSAEVPFYLCELEKHRVPVSLSLSYAKVRPDFSVETGYPSVRRITKDRLSLVLR